MIIKQIMTSPAICIDHKCTIQEAIDLMDTKDVGFLPVTKDDALIGVITDRDILLRGRNKKSNTQINKIMTDERIHTVDSSAPLEEAARIMSAHKVRRLVVIHDGVIKGVITSKDLLYQDDLLPYIKQTYLNTAY